MDLRYKDLMPLDQLAFWYGVAGLVIVYLLIAVAMTWATSEPGTPFRMSTLGLGLAAYVVLLGLVGWVIAECIYNWTDKLNPFPGMIAVALMMVIVWLRVKRVARKTLLPPVLCAVLALLLMRVGLELWLRIMRIPWQT